MSLEECEKELAANPNSKFRAVETPSYAYGCGWTYEKVQDEEQGK